MHQTEASTGFSVQFGGPHMFLEPVEFIKLDHDRQRSFCAQLASLADDLSQTEVERLAASLLRFLFVDVSLNIEDEEEVLEPILRARCLPEDGFEGISRLMRKRHRESAGLAAKTGDGLDQLAAGSAPETPLGFIISALSLVDSMTHNLDWEDRVLLPLADARLNESDKIQLGESLAQRHGFLLPPLT